MARMTPTVTATCRWIMKGSVRLRAMSGLVVGSGAFRISMIRSDSRKPMTEPGTREKIEMKKRLRSSIRWAPTLIAD